MAAIGKWASSYNMRERYPCYELKEKSKMDSILWAQLIDSLMYNPEISRNFYSIFVSSLSYMEKNSGRILGNEL